MENLRDPLVEELRSRIVALEDRAEIRELVARYAAAVTRAHCPEAADLYTEDGSFEVMAPDGKSATLRAHRPLLDTTPQLDNLPINGYIINKIKQPQRHLLERRGGCRGQGGSCESNFPVWYSPG